MSEQYLNSKEVCQILGINQLNTLYEYIHKKGLRAIKMGGNGGSRRHWRIRLSDLERWMTENQYVAGAEPEHGVSSKKVKSSSGR
jgi:excisionase family DNA binding protein